MKIIITGICGFVGCALAHELRRVQPDWEIHGLDNFVRPGSETNRAGLKALGIGLVHGDLRCASDLETLPCADYVIDAAANPTVLAGVDGRTSSRQLLEHNLGGTLNLLEYCREHRAGFILLSTSRVYSIKPLTELAMQSENKMFQPVLEQHTPGLTADGVNEAFPTTSPISLYGATKLASESFALEYGEAFGFPVWVNRCGVLAGAGQFGRADQGIFAYWIHSWLRRQPLTYIGFGGQGHQVRDCLHPRDLIPLLVAQMTSSGSQKRRVQNVSGGMMSALSLAQLSDWCQNRFGARHVDSSDSPRPFDVPWLILDSSLAQRQWNWKPTTRTTQILDEIADHAEANPHWLELSAAF